VIVKAIVQNRYGPADVLEPAEIDTPSIGDADVLLRVRAAGVDRSVWHLMTGQPRALRIAFGLRAPKQRIRGVDVSGTVAAVGPKATRWAVGDEVFGTADGSYAEFARADENQLVAKPARLDFAQAASLPISGCAALHTMRAARIEAGQRVLVLGAAGGVGAFAVQLAKAAGAHVTGVSSTTKLDLVLSLGADEALDYTRVDVTDGSAQYDTIIDIGGNRALGALRRALTRNGTLVIVGGEGGGGALLAGADRQLRAALLSPFIAQRLTGVMSSERPADLEELRRLAEAGILTPSVERTYPLEEAADAIRYLERGSVRGKVALLVSGAGS
jgi:NADPH:quinone reductase-like Zn-dependent oxidoreductase